MLHELFLLLAGNPSPLFTPKGLPESFPLLSPSERSLLNALSTLGHLHLSIRALCSSITTDHPSTIARAVASSISSTHLSAFRARILAVESSILSREAGVVGGYDIVSLAKVLSGFEGWERVLRYLHELVEAIQGGLTGAGIIDRLREDIYTGYPRLEEVALGLLEVAETAWLREISTWVLYGRLPSAFTGGQQKASTDFFIAAVDGDDAGSGDLDEPGRVQEFAITKRLLPAFVTAETAHSILFIGRALATIRLRGTATSSTAVSSPELTLLPQHLAHLQALTSPLSPQRLAAAISAIRLSLSRHTLQTLLPASHILSTITLLREFFLLGRGEFAVALLEQASEKTRNRWRRSTKSTSAVVKEGEVAAILTRTWSVLAAMTADSAADETVEHARDVLFLTLSKPPATPAKKQHEGFADLLVGVPVTLNFALSWPLELFLHPADLDTYAALFAYLIGARKTQARLQALWSGRRRPAERAKTERRVWAAASAAVFFLETLGGYWQGEVIESAFAALKAVVEPDAEEDADEGEGDVWMNLRGGGGSGAQSPSQSSGQRRRMSIRGGGQDVSVMDMGAEQDSAAPAHDPIERDPESLTRAHAAYLRTLTRALFVGDAEFAPLLKQFLRACDALAASIEAMVRDTAVDDALAAQQTPARNTRSRTAGGGKAAAAGAGAGAGVGKLVEAQCREARALMRRLVARLQAIDEEREGFGGFGGADAEEAGAGGVLAAEDVWAVAERVTRRRMECVRVDRLLMRLEMQGVWEDE